MMASTSTSSAASQFPPPPDYTIYTTENIQNGLVPKPPPVPTRFRVFGEDYDLDGPLLPTLTEIGQRQLYSPNGQWKGELKKLNRSIVANFLDLLDILINCPDNKERSDKLETIRMLFININHLINEYRPVQARNALVEMIRHQNDEIKRVNDDLQKYVELGNSALKALSVVFSEVSIKYSISSIPEPPESCLSTFSAILNLKEEENSDFLTPYKTDNEKKDTAQFVTSEKEFCDNFINSSDKIAEQ